MCLLPVNYVHLNVVTVLFYILSDSDSNTAALKSDR